MSIWAIADLHASRLDPGTRLPTKPMEKFGPRWERHMERLEASWKALVHDEDVVLLGGDTDWALLLEDALETLKRIDAWPGSKVLVRGNHDFWWSSKSTNRVRREMPPTMKVIHNDAIRWEGYNLCGAKGSPVPGGADWTPENEKLLNRELQRLEMSLEQGDPALPTIAILHYPPFYRGREGSPYTEVLERYGVEVCLYGHLHGDAWSSGPQGAHSGIVYELISGDWLDFKPLLVASEGKWNPQMESPAPEILGHTLELKERSQMDEKDLSKENVGDLAEKVIAEKREDTGDEGVARELFDVPSASAQDLAQEQEEAKGGRQN